MVNDDRPGSADRNLLLPADRFPDPVVRYGVRNGDLVVRDTNAAFDELFDGVSAGTPIREWCKECGVAVDDGALDELLAAVATGQRTTARITQRSDTAGTGTGDRRVFRLLSVPDPDSGSDGPGGGYLVLTDVTASADEAAEMDRVASVISHDLRNPLDVAKARLQAARETDDEEHFEYVVEAHERIEEIVEDVLALARGEEALDLSSSVALEEVATDAWRTVDTAGGTLTVTDDLPVTEADPARLRRVFENLFRNSIQHGLAVDPPEETESDPVQIRVGTTDDGFFVADDGPGIPPEEREAVFATGYTSDETGTGLGLAIVARIAEAHGWTVTLSESADGGTRVEFGGLDAG